MNHTPSQAVDPSHPEGLPEPHGSQRVLTDGPPPGETRAAMILVHGRGAGPDDILELGRAHRVDGFTLLAPAAAQNTWYPNSFLAPIEANEPWLSSALAVLESLVERVLEAGVPSERLVLMGFSQGACLASEFARRNPRRYGAVVAYSGGVIGPMGTTWEVDKVGGAGSLAGTPVFLGCSDVDHHIPVERVHETARLFEAMGAEVEKRIYPGMGHLVNRDEMSYVQGMLRGVVGDGNS
jgi:phospholipase/carboxylesterase